MRRNERKKTAKDSATWHNWTKKLFGSGVWRFGERNM